MAHSIKPSRKWFSNHFHVACVLLVFTILLTGCGVLEVGVLTPTETVNAPSTQAPISTEPSDTPTALPAITKSTSPTLDQPTPTATPPAQTGTPLVTEPAPMTVEIDLIALSDGGKSGTAVGCGDSAVPVQVSIPYTQGMLKAAMSALLAIKSRTYGESGLYNALYQSDLALESVMIDNGAATIKLSGSLLLGGECDNPRVKAQLEGTALQFSTVKAVVIYINDKTLDEALSLK